MSFDFLKPFRRPLRNAHDLPAQTPPNSGRESEFKEMRVHGAEGAYKAIKNLAPDEQLEELHVIPRDTIEHDVTSPCVCGPTTHIVNNIPIHEHVSLGGERPCGHCLEGAFTLASGLEIKD